MKDAEIWKEYYKFKATYKKEQILRQLFDTDEVESFEKVCELLITNRSQPLKHVLLDIAEVLEHRFKDRHDLSNLDAYQKYLKKEKLEDFKNYWYKKLNRTSRDEATQTLLSKIQSRFDKSKPGKFSVGIEFPYSHQMYGHLMITCGRGSYEPYQLSHLGFGYHTNLRSYHKSIINNYPFNQIHLDKKYFHPKNLSNVNGIFRFDEKIISLIDKFYSFHENIYDEFSQLTVDNIEDNTYLSEGISNHWFRKNIRLILGILNVHIKEKNDEQISAFAKLGIKLDKYNHYTDYLESLIK